MTVGEMRDVLDKWPRDEEVFIRQLDSDGNPMVSRVIALTASPDGNMIEAGEEVMPDEE